MAKRSLNQVLGKRRIGGYSRGNSCLSYCQGWNVDLKTADVYRLTKRSQNDETASL